MHVLRAFIIVTLVVILVPAIIGIVYAKQLETWAWTPMLLCAASALLAIAPICVVLMAAHSTRTDHRDAWGLEHSPSPERRP